MCAAYRRCGRPFSKLEPAQLEGVPDADSLRVIATLGTKHHRVPRIAGLGSSPQESGRAKCRHCRETIEAKVATPHPHVPGKRGHFAPMGFVHMTCASGYFGTTEVTPWLTFVAADEASTQAETIAAALAGPVVPGKPGDAKEETAPSE